MVQKVSRKASDIAIASARFFVPTIRVKKNKRPSRRKRIAVLIPTYVPTTETYALVQSLITFHPRILVVIIDDCTPQNKKNLPTLNKLNSLAKTNSHVVYLRTPHNALKAGALNFGLDFLLNLKRKPQMVLTFDDDVRINQDTIPFLTKALYSDPTIGAVCTQVRVKNKNHNVLTRLQALEYHSFNVTKISDNGFLKGPLVMQGMLTAFRMTALQEINGYTHGHLIEDYDITARLKVKGWHVKIAHTAVAWTNVPENLEALWKQRVRWTSGGLHVLQTFWRNVPVIYQDLIGHALFLGLLFLIIVSLLLPRHIATNALLTAFVLTTALVNFAIAFSFNMYMLTIYPKRDRKDLFLRASILPEFIYSNILSLVLVGSYLFFAYKLIPKKLFTRFAFVEQIYQWGMTVFQKAGFSTTWGTR